jgi:hypothetical protein
MKVTLKGILFVVTVEAWIFWWAAHYSNKQKPLDIVLGMVAGSLAFAVYIFMSFLMRGLRNKRP